MPSVLEATDELLSLVAVTLECSHLFFAPVELITHHVHEQLARLLRASLVDEVVDVEEDESDLLEFWWEALRIDSHRLHDVEELDEQAPAQLLELHYAIAAVWR